MDLDSHLDLDLDLDLDLVSGLGLGLLEDGIRKIHRYNREIVTRKCLLF